MVNSSAEAGQWSRRNVLQETRVMRLVSDWDKDSHRGMTTDCVLIVVAMLSIAFLTTPFNGGNCYNSYLLLSR